MTSQFSKIGRERHRGSERGAFLLVLASSIVVVLVLVGYAVDSAKLYRSRLWIQSAVDAAAAGGIAQYTLRYRSGSGDPPQAAIEAAESLIDESMSRRGINVISRSATFNRTSFELSVQAEISLNFWFMHLLPGYRNGDRIVSTASAVLPPAIVNLVLDISGSMLCPSSGPCDCKDPSCLGGRERKIDALARAVRQFIGYFDQTRDKIALTAFNLGASNLVPFSPTAGFSPSDLNTWIDLLDDLAGGTRMSATNTTDGLLQASWLDPGIGGTGPENRAYVLFTDGAPTAARFSFASNLRLPPNRDFYSWDVAWGDINNPGAGFNLSSSALVEAPTPLVAPPIPPGPRLAVPFLPHAPWDPFLLTVSSPPPGAIVPPCSVADPLDPARSFNQCLDRIFDFYTPDGISHGFATPFAQYREQYYHSAIAMADYLRKSRSVVYAIGIGANPTSGGDEYQNINDYESRKDYFLARLANDPVAEYLNHPEFLGFERNAVDPYSGLALGSASTADLEDFFDTVARRIKLRLVR